MNKVARHHRFYDQSSSSMGNFTSNETWLIWLIWLYVGKTLASHAGEQPAALDVPILFTLRNKSADGR